MALVQRVLEANTDDEKTWNKVRDVKIILLSSSIIFKAELIILDAYRKSRYTDVSM